MIYSMLGTLMLLLLQPVLSQQAVPDKYTDENRPYKFGFNIDGYQHRNEEKNEKGIIKGEYGFITADGYYRVTKYETDENGKFKIISMKNYYVGFPPENPTTTPPSIPRHTGSGRPKLIQINQTEKPIPVKIVDSDVSVEEFPTSSTPESLEREKTIKLTSTTRRFNIFKGQSGCSHCIIPTTSKPSTSNFNENNVDYRVGINLFEEATPKRLKISDRNQDLNSPEKQTVRKNDSAFKNSQGDAESDIKKPNLKKDNDGNILKKKFNFPKNDPNLGEVNLHNDPKDERYLPKTKDLFVLTNFSKPLPGAIKSKFADNVKHINTNNSQAGQRSNFENDQKDDSLIKSKNKLLYTFNYTLGFHGHHENGFRNGDKEGDYFFDGKDGTKRNVTYIANEFGYQPNITLTDLNDNEKRRFDGDNEKDNNELKGYEFKWFYTRRK